MTEPTQRAREAALVLANSLTADLLVACDEHGPIAPRYAAALVADRLAVTLDSFAEDEEAVAAALVGVLRDTRNEIFRVAASIDGRAYADLVALLLRLDLVLKTHQVKALCTPEDGATP